MRPEAGSFQYNDTLRWTGKAVVQPSNFTVRCNEVVNEACFTLCDPTKLLTFLMLHVGGSRESHWLDNAHAWTHNASEVHAAKRVSFPVARSELYHAVVVPVVLTAVCGSFHWKTRKPIDGSVTE